MDRSQGEFRGAPNAENAAPGRRPELKRLRNGLVDVGLRRPEASGEGGVVAPTSDQHVGQPRLFIVFPDLISSASLRHLPDVLQDDFRVHPLLIPLLLGPIGRSPLTVEEIAETLLGTIRTAQPEGPYRLLGYSFGGLVAYELGRRLHADGEQVAWLGLLDTHAPALVRQLERKRVSPSGRMARLRAKLREGGCSTLLIHFRHRAREKLIAAGLARRRPGEQFDIRHAFPITLGCTIEGHDLPMNLVVTTATVKETGSDSLGWVEMHKGPLELHTEPGDHDAELPKICATYIALGLASLSDRSVEPQTTAGAEG